MWRHSTSAIALILMAGCGTDAPAPSDTSPPSQSQSPNAKTMSETERLNEFFQSVFEARLEQSPQFKTALGIKTDYDKWDDPSPEAAAEDLAAQRQAVADMRAQFDFDALTPGGQLSWRLAEYQLETAEAAFAFRNNAYLFDQMRGVQGSIPAFLINQHRVTDLSDAEAYIARLEGVGAYLGSYIDQAEARADAGVMPPRFVFDYVIESAQNVITGAPFASAEEPDFDSPLLDDFRKKVTSLVGSETIDEETATKLMERAAAALETSVGPTYTRLISLMEAHKAIATDDDGAWKLPDGAAYYQARLKQMTTTDMTATEIHDLGLAEMDRIHGEMRQIMASVGYEGPLQDFFEYLRSDERFYKPNTPEGKAEYLAEATALIDTMRGRLPEVFNTFPEADLIVKAVEPFREKAAGKAFYQSPARDGSRPGTYYANLYDMSAMPIYQMEALAYHEGIPGHHMQRAIAQELTGLPEFRKYVSATAYTEGWGLYSEYLPKEMGFYEDPYSDFGRLAMELWRAARLVVDTGLHDKKWTRQQAIDYLLENTPNPEWDCIKAIDRYIVMPGQATAYKIGMIRILELRERARTTLGDRFDIRDYHDVVLRDGPVPLAILEEKVDAWIAEVAAGE